MAFPKKPLPVEAQMQALRAGPGDLVEKDALISLMINLSDTILPNVDMVKKIESASPEWCHGYMTAWILMLEAERTPAFISHTDGIRGLQGFLCRLMVKVSGMKGFRHG